MTEYIVQYRLRHDGTLHRAANHVRARSSAAAIAAAAIGRDPVAIYVTPVI